MLLIGCRGNILQKSGNIFAEVADIILLKSNRIQNYSQGAAKFEKFTR